MATSTYLSNPVVTVNAVDVTDQTSAANLTRVIEALESTSFGKTARVYVGGLENSTLTLTMYNSFAASETYATLSALVGTSTTVTFNQRRCDQRHEPNFNSDWLLPRDIANRQRRTRRTRHH
jgi:hypothetical protein